MSVSDKAAAALEGLGLTQTEIRSYAALLERGTMTASEVSRAARVPYSKVYQALESLHKKGWVDRQRIRPILYTAKPPESALEELRAQHEAESREKEKVALAEIVSIYERKGEQERPDIWILRGTSEILSRVKNTVVNSRNELLIALPLGIAPYADQVAALLTAVKERGVKISILTSLVLPEESLSALSSSAEVRTRKTMFGGGVIADSKEVVLLLGGGGSGEAASSPLAIWADHPGLASFARDYFEFLWDSRETVKQQAVGPRPGGRPGQGL
ncbi:MAG: TrmB family transcriptional regulator [Nitrososphaerota archaeon]|nr:TrmB family transcriptional regulator [Nitrososphaerota archaeon]